MTTAKNGRPPRTVERVDDELGADVTYTAARAAAMAADAGLKRLELRERRGELLERGAVEAQVAAFVHRLRERLLAWPARVAPALAAQFAVDAVALDVALETHVAALCSALADETLGLG